MQDNNEEMELVSRVWHLVGYINLVIRTYDFHVLLISLVPFHRKLSKDTPTSKP